MTATKRLTKTQIYQIRKHFTDIYLDGHGVTILMPRAWKGEISTQIRRELKAHEVNIICNLDIPRVIVSSGVRYHSISLED